MATSQLSEWRIWATNSQATINTGFGKRFFPLELASPHQELAEDPAVGESCPSHADVLTQTQILDLVLDPGTAASVSVSQSSLGCFLEAHLLSSQSFGRLVSFGLMQRM